MGAIPIRPYKSSDRDALRNLCCDVADRGEPIENIFFDREIAADLLSRYYTDYEPACSFVAESDGQVVGYITGCLDNRRYGLVMFWLLLPLTFVKAFMRGVFFRREFWRLAYGYMVNWRRLFAWRKKSFHSHQGHLHIGISRDFRHHHTGEALVQALVDHALLQGATRELAASVHDSNAAAMRFFGRLGFVLRERYPMVVTRGKKWEHYNALLYVKAIGPG